MTQPFSKMFQEIRELVGRDDFMIILQYCHMAILQELM
jgi:hypothetical protein